ncbi:MAG: ABC transporter permease [bacterium]|nr:ABC transporter permease [bacterium]
MQKTNSPLRIAFRRLRRHKMAMLGLWVLGILYCSAIFADFIAPYPYYEDFRNNANQPPTPIHFFDETGKFSFRPFVYEYTLQIDTQTYQRKYLPDRTQKNYIYFFTTRNEMVQGGRLRTSWHLFGVKDPGHIFIFGTDTQGRDIFSRILHGSRVSLSIGLLGVLISFTIGMVIGGISGYFGGKFDYLMMRFGEIIMMVPSMFLLLALRAAFLGLKLSSVEVFFMIVFIMSFIGWAGLARVIRGMVLSIREREYVLAAQALGVPTWKIIIKHILPNTFSFAIVSATLDIPSYILGESALSLLGLGIVEPQASWGNMLSAAQNLVVLEQYPWILIPGFFIFITVLAFNFLGDGLRDAFDPNVIM